MCIIYKASKIRHKKYIKKLCAKCKNVKSVEKKIGINSKK